MEKNKKLIHVWVDSLTHKKLKILSVEEEKNIGDVIDLIIEKYNRQKDLQLKESV